LKAVKLQLLNNHFYFTLPGKLYSGIINNKALANFETAAAVANTQTEKQVLAIRKQPVNFYMIT